MQLISHKHLLTYNDCIFRPYIAFMHYFCTCFYSCWMQDFELYVIHWSSGCEGHNYRQDLVIWLLHLINSAVGFAV